MPEGNQAEFEKWRDEVAKMDEKELAAMIEAAIYSAAFRLNTSPARYCLYLAIVMPKMSMAEFMQEQARNN